MRIPCPYCGERDASEFTYRGDAAPRAPDGRRAGAEAWHDYVYLRDNPAGAASRVSGSMPRGCRAWLVVTRNTRTHEIAAPRRAPATASRGRGRMTPVASGCPSGGRIDRCAPLALHLRRQRATPGFAGDTLASALLANGVTLVGRSSNIIARAAS